MDLHVYRQLSHSHTIGAKTTSRTHFKHTQIHVNELSITINPTIAIVCMLMLALHLQCNWFLAKQTIHEQCSVDNGHDDIFSMSLCAVCIVHWVNSATVCQYRFIIFIIFWVGRFSVDEVQSATPSNWLHCVV